MDRHKDSRRLYFYSVLVMGGLMAIFIVSKSSGILDSIVSIEAFRKYIGGYGDRAYIAFFIIQFISVIIAPIPSNISTAAGGAIFGMWASFIISTLAIIAGSAVVFIAARKLGRPFVEKFVSPRISGRYEKHISSANGEVLLALLFFLPLLPDDAICFLAGLSRIRLNRYLFIMLLTRPWGILAASAVGSSDIIIEWWVWAIISLIILWLIKRRDEIEQKVIGIFKKE